MTEQQRIVTEIAKMVRLGGRSLAVLAGAGISRPSKLPLGGEIVAKIIQLLTERAECLGFKLSKGIRNILLQIRPEIVFDVLQSNYKLNTFNASGLPMSEILSGFKDAMPNGIHYFLAHLLSTGSASVVVTTNYDDLIEKAYSFARKLGGFPDARPQVVSTVRDLARLNPGAADVFKIHGNLDGRPKASPRFAVQHFASVPEKFLKRFQRILETNDLLVLGYSGRDDFSLKPLLLSPLPRRSARRIFWIEHLSPHATDILGLQTNPPREIIRSRDRRFLHNVATATVRKAVAKNGSALLTTNTEEFVAQLALALRFPAMTFSDPTIQLRPYGGLEKWFGTLEPHIAVICLSQLVHKADKASTIHDSLGLLIGKRRHNRIEHLGSAQLHFEFAMVCKAIGEHSNAQFHFKKAFEGLVAASRKRRNIPEHLKHFADRIKMMWGFSLKDDALSLRDDDKSREPKLREAHKKFSEQTHRFGRNLMARVEAPWIWKDLAATQRDHKRLDLLQLAKDKWTELLRERKGRLPRVEIGKLHFNLSWAHFDLGFVSDDCVMKVENWLRTLDHIDKSARIFSDIVELNRKGKSLSTACTQRSRIAGALLTSPKAASEARRRGIRLADMFRDAAQNVEDASDLFSALGDLPNLVFCTASNAWLAYAEGKITLGNQHCRALQNARKHAPLSEWEQAIWIPYEIKRLRAFRKQMIKAIR
jgi:hypothetical protein